VGMLRLFAELIAFHLNAIDQLTLSETKLLEEKRTAELREQFIAILGHDLRNPLSAVSNSAQLLLRLSAEEDVLHLAGIIKNSSYRMSGLIENILDFARGRLGGGINMDRRNDEPLERVLNQVITELHAIWPHRALEIRFQLSEPVYCDGNRIAQLFSNILGNAITHGKPDEPVRVEAKSSDGIFTLSVANCCNPIPASILDHIFEPFARGGTATGQQGLGLGLYIASEIAHAHGGTINAISTEQETRFTLQMPS
jgi:signal transduction histidine kinase